MESFQLAQLVYDLTVRLCDPCLQKRSRTHDQMLQAARSWVQKIVEGSPASSRSTNTELRLTNVARAGFEELRLDYEDFSRQRGLEEWAPVTLTLAMSSSHFLAPHPNPSFQRAKNVAFRQ